MPANVFVITGTPGTGKTSLAKKLKDQGFKTINLQEFAIQNNCQDGYDNERDSVIIDEDKIEEVLIEYLDNLSDTVIIEGHYGDLVPELFVNKCFVLTAELTELKNRLSKRNYSEQKIRENMDAEIVKECWITALDAFGEDRVIEINPMPEEEVFQLVLNEIS